MESLFCVSPLFREFNTGLTTEEINITARAFDKVLQNREQEYNEFIRRKEEERNAYPYQFEQVVFTDEEKAKYNYDETRPYYYITYKGCRISDKMFLKHIPFSCGDALDYINKKSKRYIILYTVAVGEYDETIVQRSKLESKYYLFTRECVFDTYFGNVVFESDQKSLYPDKHITIYGNLMHYDDKIYYLPDMEIIYTGGPSYNTNILESADHICFKSKYDKTDPIIVISKTNGVMMTY